MKRTKKRTLLEIDIFNFTFSGLLLTMLISTSFLTHYQEQPIATLAVSACFVYTIAVICTVRSGYLTLNFFTDWRHQAKV
jgi:hypothetical protein